MSSSFHTKLKVTKEKDRKNGFISPVLTSQATVFHPASSITSVMQAKLTEIKKSGSDPKTPLESVQIHRNDKCYRIDLHVDYLLQTHRDVLDTILAYAETIQLSDTSYQTGERMTWKDVYQTALDDQALVGQEDDIDVYIDKDATVLSMSMHELTKRMGIAATFDNYELIVRLITQLSTAHLVVNELEDNNYIVEKKSLTFVQDYRFHYNKNNPNIESLSRIGHINHIFLVPDIRLLRGIRDHGYYNRLEQQKMSHYHNPSIRSFLKFITTYNKDFLHNRKLSWAIDKYLESIVSPVDNDFGEHLKRDLIIASAHIKEHFNLEIKNTGNGIKIFYTKSNRC